MNFILINFKIFVSSKILFNYVDGLFRYIWSKKN